MKKETTTPVTKSTELLQLEETHGTVHTIEGTDTKGNTVVMYLKKPDYKLKKAVFVALAGGEEKNPMMAAINAGEMFLLGCYVGGYNMYNDEEMRLEAALKAAELCEINDTIQLKKS